MPFVPAFEGQKCSLGYTVIDWLQEYACHGPGDVMGQPLNFADDPEVEEFIVGCYLLDPVSGRRVKRRAVYSAPKGRAKSEVAGLLGVAECLSEVRFDGWDAYGQPVGRPIVSPFVRCLATEEKQAGNTFQNLAFIMGEWGPDSHPDVYGNISNIQNYQQTTKLSLPDGGEAVLSTAGAASKDGGKGATYALEGWDGKPFEFENEYLTDIKGRAACEFIRKGDAAKPWFLYVAFNAPHGPLQASEKYLSRFAGIADEKRRTYAAMVSALDDAVGAILVELKTQGAEDNTLIFFLSDNGGPLDRNSSLNTPLSGEKGFMLEGGIRTPYLVQWKAKLPTGKVYEQPVSSLNISATALAAAKTEAPANLDGVDLVPYLTGDKEGRPHEALYWRMTARGIWAIRMGDWKLVTHNGWHEIPAAKPKPRLIHLASDPGELHDLSEKEPAKLAELQNAYNAWAATLPEPLWTTDVSPEAVKARQERVKRQNMKK